MRAFGFLTDFSRVNRRMHNKSFTADSQAAVPAACFADLDVMAIGPVVTEVAKDFDRYWNSESSYRADGLLAPVDRAAADALAATALQLEGSPRALAYTGAVRSSVFFNDLVKGTLPMEWAVTRMVSDDPAKGLGRAKQGTLILDKLRQTMGEPAAELNLVSPYFVPTAAAVDAFAAMAKKGVKHSEI